MDNRSFNILVVDGSYQTTDLISHLLQMEGLFIYTAESGLNALAKINLFNPDIVVANVSLPDISGFDLCKRIKTDERARDVLVLLFSAVEGGANRLRAEEMGADDFIEINADHYLYVSKVRSLMRVKALSNQLRQKYAELEEKNHLLDMQLEMGTQVQRSLLPEIDMKFKECALLSRYYPAMGIGGDFFNVHPLTENSMGIVIGDVSGHGIAAAFLTVILKMMISNLIPKYYNPDQLLYYLNNELYDLFEKNEQTYYASVFYAVVNTRDKYIRFANAGHSLPLYVDSERNAVAEMESSGIPVGMMKDSRYEMQSLIYRPSDVMLFFTDGLQEIFYKNQPDEFVERMRVVLTEISQIDELKEVMDIICDNFYHSGASETKRMEMDDVSMILCRL